ncbi:hypothetical protein GCM10009566_70830 [Streptomyces murinus]
MPQQQRPEPLPVPEQDVRHHDRDDNRHPDEPYPDPGRGMQQGRGRRYADHGQPKPENLPAHGLKRTDLKLLGGGFGEIGRFGGIGGGWCGEAGGGCGEGRG